MGVFCLIEKSYSVGMNDLVKLAADITKKRGLTLILNQDRARQNKTSLIARLILNGPLLVVSGDEWLPDFALSRIVYKQTIQIKEVLKHLRTVRASTSFRLWDSLASIQPKGEPILVLEFLHTFYDANIPLYTRLFRLRESCRELARLAFYRPVIVMTRIMESEDYEKFIPALSPIANQTFTLETEVEQIKQPVLF